MHEKLVSFRSANTPLGLVAKTQLDFLGYDNVNGMLGESWIMRRLNSLEAQKYKFTRRLRIVFRTLVDPSFLNSKRLKWTF